MVSCLAIIGVFIILNQEKTQKVETSSEDLAQKAIDYINENMLSDGLTASLVNVVEESGLYKIHIKIGEEEYDSYVSKDGKLLFPPGFIELEGSELEDFEESVPETQNNNLDNASLETLAKCLEEKGAKFYGTSGCGYCNKQKELFGEAAQYLPYVECADEKTRHICEEAEIGPVPTWDFPDGKRVSGLQSLEELIELSGCSL
jgi:hypothetical protein